MTLQTRGLADSAQFQGMRIMTVAASHALRMHATLQERPIDVDLIEHLPVTVIQRRADQGRLVRVACSLAWRFFAFKQKQLARNAA